MRPLRFDLKGRYAVAVGADGKHLGFVVSAQRDGAGAMLTDREPDDAAESDAKQILRMTKTRIQLARECARDKSLGVDP